MPRLTPAQKKVKQIQALEKTRLIIQSKLRVLGQALSEVDAKLLKLTA